MEKAVKKKTIDKLIDELQGIANKLADGYKRETGLSEELHIRNVFIGRLTVLGSEIEQLYYAEKRKLVEETEKPEWKINTLMENTDIGMLFRLKKQLFNTLEIQCKNITSEMIEIQSDRKTTR